MGRKKKEVSSEEPKKELTGREKSNLNLIPQSHKLTHEDRIKSGLTRAKNIREGKELRNLVREFLEQDACDAYQVNMKRLGMNQVDKTNKSALVAALFAKAMKGGDAKCAKTLMEWAGYDPELNLKVEQFEHTKENGSNINVKVEGELETTSRVQIYLPEIDKEEE